MTRWAEWQAWPSISPQSVGEQGASGTCELLQNSLRWSEMGLSHPGLQALTMELGHFGQQKTSGLSANSGTLSAILHLAIPTCKHARTGSGPNNVKPATE